MSEASLTLSALSAVLAGAVYAYVGLRISRRRVSGEARTAQVLFCFFWFALAGSSLLRAFQLALYMNGHLAIWLYSGLGQVAVLAIVVALVGLLYYLLYLYTGTNRIAIPLIVYGLVLYATFQALIAWYGPPPALGDDGWAIQRLPEVKLQPAAGLLFVAFFLGPQLAAAVAYALLYRKAREPTQRYRIAMVSGGFFVWFGSTFVATGLGLQGRLWQVFSLMLSLAAAMVILLAYLPPPGWRRRWGLRSIDEEARGPVAPMAGAGP
ncbi:MAG TPA: hypothetical protein VM286_04465 [Candidatus Thermoplasmatota archaeon]|nr:hypothetical protein [Candidatus Thermoplasmatota archaeon]